MFSLECVLVPSASTDRHLALLKRWLSSLPSLARFVGASAVDLALLVVRSSMLSWSASEGRPLSIGDVALDAALISHDIPAGVVAQRRLKGESAAHVTVLARFMLMEMSPVVAIIRWLWGHALAAASLLLSKVSLASLSMGLHVTSAGGHAPGKK